jgi:hypothetical protein
VALRGGGGTRSRAFKGSTPAQRGLDPEKARNESFDCGLDRVLDGIEIQLRRDR